MAKTFTLVSGAYQTRYLEVYCEQTTDIASNTSTIKWTLSSKGGTSNYYQTGPTTVIIAGQQVYYSPVVAWDSKKFPAAKGSVSGTLTVEHDNYGNKTIAVSLSTSIYTGVVSTYNGNWELDSIPRQATITSAPDFNDTQLPTVTYSNPIGDKAEALEICIADDRAWYAYVPYRPVNKTGTLSYTFTADDVTALKNIAGNTLALTFVLRTKIGGEYLYHTVPKTFTVTDNDDTKPSVYMEFFANNGDQQSILGDMYVQSKTRFHVALSAEGKYGANIDSYWVTIDGKTYNGHTVTIDGVSASGNVEVIGCAKDSRGFTGFNRQSIHVVEYSKPSVTVIAYRCNSSGEEDQEGAYMRVGFEATITDLDGKNSASYTIRYGGTPITGSGTSYLSNPIACDVSRVWSIEVKVDDLLDSTTKAAVIPIAFTLMDFYHTGQGVALGKVATRDGFDCAMPAYFTGGVYVDGKTLAEYIEDLVSG